MRTGRGTRAPRIKIKRPGIVAGKLAIASGPESDQVQRAWGDRMFGLMLETFGVIVLVADFNETVLVSAGRGLASIGTKPGAWVGSSLRQVLSNQPELLAGARRALAGEELTTVRPLVGLESIWDTRCSPLRDELGEVVGAAVLSIDVTERERLAVERELLLAQLMQAQEEERRRIAADIHDDSIQVMTAVGIRLELLRWKLDVPDQLEAVAKVEEAVRASIGRLRQLLFELRPPSLVPGGLGSAVRAYLAQAAEIAGFEHRVEERLASEPVGETLAVLYRCLQEAVNNAAHHASASTVTVTLAQVGNIYQASVQDDGRGFTAARRARHAGRPGHLGLSLLRERAELAGGSATIDSAPGEGTRVVITVPQLERRKPAPRKKRPAPSAKR